jgi:hypothetical protein
MNTNTNVCALNDEPLGMAALKEVEQDIKDNPAPAGTAVGFDIPARIATALGCWPKISALASEIEKLPNFNVGEFNKTLKFALALGYANGLYMAATEPVDTLVALTEQGTALCSKLCSDLQTAMVRSYINAKALDDYLPNPGYKNLATNLLMVTAVHRQNAEALAGKCATTQQELEEGDRIAYHILRLWGLREQGPEAIAQTADTRLRLYSLFVHAWDQTQRAVTYLRWDAGDADTIAPSLFAGKKRKATATEATTVAAAPATTPAVSVAAGTAAATPAAVVTTPKKLDNLPGGNPFMS